EVAQAGDRDDQRLLRARSIHGPREGDRHPWQRHHEGDPRRGAVMARKAKTKYDAQGKLLDITGKLKTAVCVPALREALKAWRVGGYKGVTDTTRTLLNHWFHTDHRLANGRPFAWHESQRDAMETLIFVWEFEKVRTRKG